MLFKMLLRETFPQTTAATQNVCLVVLPVFLTNSLRSNVKVLQNLNVQAEIEANFCLVFLT